MAKQVKGKGISWTDQTWNPIRGCSRVSEGCRNCYAERDAYRFSGQGQAYAGLVRIGADGKRRQEWNGQVNFIEKHLLDPMKWTEPRRVFVNSMSDLFHEGVSDEQRDRIFAVMALCPQHTFQVLTKRPERMLAYLNAAEGKDRRVGCAESICEVLMAEHGWTEDVAWSLPWPLPNVWLGVSVEDQISAETRIPPLLSTPAAVRFISAEPLLDEVRLLWRWVSKGKPFGGGPQINLQKPWEVPEPLSGIDWVIVGGESGPLARQMFPDWARLLRDQCVAADVPFFFKQWGEWGQDMQRVGKKASGDLLDGKQWHQFPETDECSATTCKRTECHVLHHAAHRAGTIRSTE